MGRAIEFGFGRAKNGTEQVGVVCELVEGDFKGKQGVWYGFFNTKENSERAFRSLMYLGWDGVDLTKLTGLGTKTAALTCGEETFEGKSRWKIKFVDDPESDGIFMADRFNPEQTADFANRMSGLLSEFRAKRPAAGAAKPPAAAPQNSGPQQAAKSDKIPF